jgi:acyl-CoA dehydrogenase
MMNSARLNIGIQSVGVAEAATQLASAYAKQRQQGNAINPAGDVTFIEHHPDVLRMLLTMKAMTAAARAICLLTAFAIDGSRRLQDPQARRAAAERASLLIPVAKAFSSDAANEVASLGVQVHGGVGFIEEMGAAQFLRDARIGAIYEGTNGIQAIDLIERKLALSGGSTVRREIEDMRGTLGRLDKENAIESMRLPLQDAVDALERATAFMWNKETRHRYEKLAGASPYLRLFAYARGGTALAKAVLVAGTQVSETDPELVRQVAIARFFAENIAVGAKGLELAILNGAESVRGGEALLN